MSVYVDPLFDTTALRSAKWRFTESCHMTADTHAELMWFAGMLGLSPSWLQHPGRPSEHFDLTKGKRWQAIALGAIEITKDDAARRLLKSIRG